MTGAVTGIDLGVASFLTTSEGLHVPNPRHLKASATRLAAGQRDLARKKRGSNRRKAAVSRVAALHGTVRRQRLDHAHKTALRLVQDHDVICHEALQIDNMTRRAKPVPDPAQPGAFLPNGQAQKSGLSKAILDAGWGVFLSVLTAKAENAGRELIAVNPANTSRTCPKCGHCAKGNRPSQAVFTCQKCRFTGHADTGRCDQRFAGRNCPSPNRSRGLSEKKPLPSGRGGSPAERHREPAARAWLAQDGVHGHLAGPGRRGRPDVPAAHEADRRLLHG